MEVAFSAALDNVPALLERCPSRAWLAAAQQWMDQRTKKSSRLALPSVAMEQALIGALGEGLPLGDLEAVDLPLRQFPVTAWQTPDGVELAFSTLSAAVCSELAHTDEPVTIARSTGGWRMPLSVFQFADGLKTVRVTSRTRLDWSDFASLREHLLDLIADSRQPLLARLAEVVAVTAQVQAERALPSQYPELSARLFLAWRGFLEARVSSCDIDHLTQLGHLLAPLYQEVLPLSDASALGAALNDDWRQGLREWLVPCERDVTPAIEAYLGARLFAAPLYRYRTLVRGYVELVEGFAAGLRVAAAVGRMQHQALRAEQMVACLAVGEHYVSLAGAALPSFALPKPSHDRGPRMADLDMTLESIC